MKKFRIVNVALDNVWPWILELFENLIFSVGLIQRDHKINIYDQRVTYAFHNVICQNAYRIWSENFNLWINTWAKNSRVTYFHVTCGQFALVSKKERYQELEEMKNVDNGGL